MIKFEVLDPAYNVLATTQLLDSQDAWTTFDDSDYAFYANDISLTCTRMGILTYVRVTDTKTGKIWGSIVNEHHKPVSLGDILVFLRNRLQVHQGIEEFVQVGFV